MPNGLPRLAISIHGALITLLICGVLLFSVRTEKIEHRIFLRPIEITIDRGAPPYSAFEDSRALNVQASAPVPQPARQLVPLTVDARVSAGKIQEMALKNLAHRKLQGLTIALVEEQKPRLSPREQVAKQYWATVTEPENMHSRAAELVAEALAQKEVAQRPQESTRTITTEKGSVIFISREPARNNENKTNAEALVADKPRKIVRLPVVPPAIPAKPAPVSLPTTPGPVIAGLSNHRDDATSPNTLAGSIRLKGGAAILPGTDDLRIYHIRDQEARSEAAITLSEARYKIDVDRPQGYLVAEIRNRDGILTARGEKSLLGLPREGLRQGRLDHIDIDLRPSHHDLRAHIQLAESSPRKPTILHSAQVEVMDLSRRLAFNKRAEGFHDPDIVSPSQVFVRAQAKDTWPTIQQLLIGEEAPVEVPSQRTVMALLESAFERREALEKSRQGIIWGTVRKNGQPIAGAVVSLLTQQQSQTKYFSGPLLDKNRITTSENGEFVIFGARGGGDLLLVQRMGEELNPSIVFIKEGNVTRVDLDYQNQNMSVRAFDVSTDEILPAAAGFMGAQTNYAIADQGEQNWFLAKDPSVLLVDAGEGFVMGSVCVSTQMREAAVPIFNEKDYNTLLQSAVHVSPELRAYSAYGVIVGDNYVVSVPSVESQAHIIYLNPDGTQRSEDFGVEGGAFVIVGLTPGFHTLAIVPERTKKVIARPIWISEGMPAATFTNVNL